MTDVEKNIQYVRGEILHFVDDPSKVNPDDSYEYFADGLMVIENGKVKSLGEAKDFLPLVDAEIVHYENGLIVPGFIDTHVHYPQTEMIASFGEQLLGWLETYAFPTEKKFADYSYALEQADFFLDQLLRNGTTTALVFGTVHPESVEAFFEKAQGLKLRMICGKVLMDRNAPADLLDTAERGYEESRALIKKWHGVDRLQYAVTPRFAPTSTDEQLHLAGKLLTLAPDLYMHTHLAENKDELIWVKELFPDNENYLDIYYQHGLLSRRSVFAHCIHLCEEELAMMSEQECSAAFCPTSNLFIGSGLFNLKQAEDSNIKVGLGTDVGGGTSFSMLQTINEAYKIQQLQNEVLPPLKSFYLATLGGARALDVEDKVGSFKLGNEADFIVLDYAATALIEKRISHCNDIVEKLFVLSILGDDRCIRATHILGECVHSK
ncbi:MAG: guanine deaminase [Flavobacterium sp.]|jgi:guanine deaminase